jgi:glucokinase
MARSRATLPQSHFVDLGDGGWRGDCPRWNPVRRPSGNRRGTGVDGPACNSGNQGSLEQYASVQAIRRETGLEPEELGRLAIAGDEKAIEFWHTYGRNLGVGLASLIYVLTPEAIIIGGGISASAEFFFPTMQAELERRVLLSSRESLQILPAQLGNQAGMVGAAKLAWQLLGDC